MPATLDRGDRKILIAAAIAMAVLTVASLFVARPTQERIGFPSSYSPASDGAKAAYLLLLESGYDVKRWESPPTRLPADPNGYVLVVAEPFIYASADERAALNRFVSGGGRILATGFSGAMLLPQNDAKTAGAEFEWRTYPPTTPSALGVSAREIKMQPRVRWGNAFPSHVPLFADNDGPVVMGYRFGQGEVIWWADHTPLTNAGLRESGNLELLLGSIGDRATVRILWDEYYHGHRAGMWSYMERTPVPWGLLQLAVIGTAILFTFARRSGPVRVPVAEQRLSPLEFVETVGGLYQRAHAASAAVEIAYKRFRFLMARQFGIPITAKPRDVHEAAHYRLGSDTQFLETLQDCEHAIYDPEFARQQGLDLVQRLHHYADLMKLQTYQENR